MQLQLHSDTRKAKRETPVSGLLARFCLSLKACRGDALVKLESKPT
ncbi:hypothetical protein M0804_012808 [Polistes exclamans]|nr:hypothetical protein M0804_012808 [Polistes exclamans]